MYFSTALQGGIKAKLKAFTTWMVGFGVAGIFLLALLDGAAVPTAGAVDAALVVLCSVNPWKWWEFAVAAAIGSTIGSAFLYTIAQRAGQKVMASVSEVRRRRIENLFGKFDILVLVVASILPPPFPFKPFIICAGAVRIPLFRFCIGLLIGRLSRYLVFAYLAMRFGERTFELMKQNSGWVFLGVVVLGLAVWLWSRRGGKVDAFAASGTQRT